jgi:alpha/beta superfamily hydrolase
MLGSRTVATALFLFAVGAGGCSTKSDNSSSSPAPSARASGDFSLVELRRRQQADGRASAKQVVFAPEPPAGVLENVAYPSPLGRNRAYVTPVRDGKGPAIVWLAGGFDFGIDDTFWKPAPADNDQSAAIFREAHIAEMYPALRGATGNAGRHECFLGEVDDVLAAAEFLAQRADVDPKRVYLGGHSTGGTLALLAAESTARFRAIFAFGPVADVRQYGTSGCLPEMVSAEGIKARSPIHFLREIVSPTFVIEGDQQGNGDVLPLLQAKADRAPITFIAVRGASHFSVLRPASRVVARAILADTAPTPSISISREAIEHELEPSAGGP